MSILFDSESKTFHLRNRWISYIIKILPNEQLGQLYFGKAVRRSGSFDHLVEPACRPTTSYVFEEEHTFSLEHVRQEYPSYGTGDFRHPAIRVREKSGSAISDFRYAGHEITEGKPTLAGLPATYCEDVDEAETLHIHLEDPLTGVRIELLYTVYSGHPAIARSARIVNAGADVVSVEDAMSFCLDLPDADYDWVQLSGAWGRERHILERRLTQGIQSVESTRGNSSHVQNPFVMLKRPGTTEDQGEAIGLSLIYSGNFLAQAEVDTWDVTRLMIGINPFGFSWKLEAGEALQLPEAVAVYSDAGVGAMSRTFHTLYRERLARGCWRDRPRPILINNWECMTYDISEERLLVLAEQARDCGIELFVLDDGWFGNRTSDARGLGDWDIVRDVLPNGIPAFSERIEALGMQFGIWIEPEMFNRDSELFRAHPDWALQVPGRRMSHGRNEFTLDYSRKEVVDHIYGVLSKLLSDAKISYVKWDMNRSITEAHSLALAPDRQGETLHRFILGVYDLYERLTTAFPNILFESCASGGGRFDPGMLHYAPQCWLSDDTDAVERILMQYGTSLCYPVSSFGAHVSAVPNQQVFRNTPLRTRANVAYFGTFGYELDLGELTQAERDEIREQVTFAKQYRELFQFGSFYRLISPFENRHFASWMVADQEKETAIIGWYKLLNEVNGPYHRVFPRGLDEAASYQVTMVRGTEETPVGTFGGDELMQIGLVTTDAAAGEWREGMEKPCDFDSRLYLLRRVRAEQR